MSRNKIDTNRALFARLADRSAEDRPIALASRYVSTTKQEQKWLVDSKREDRFRFDSVNQILLLSLDDVRYFLLVNIECPELPEGLNRIEVNAGLLTALALEEDLFQPLIDPLQIYDEIFFPLPEGYKGHDAELIQQFLVPLSLIEISDQGPFFGRTGLFRFAIFCACEGTDLRTLQFLPETLAACKQLSFEDSSVPAALIAHALVSVRWEHCFLEFYRCVERLYSLPTVLMLKSELGINQSGIAISRALEASIGWRKPEEDGLTGLIAECTVIAEKFHKEFATMDASLTPDFSQRSIAKHLYKLRNSIVHYRPYNEAPALTEAAWQSIVHFLTDAIAVLYQKFETELSEQATAVRS